MTYFYGHLFAAEPEIGSMFPPAMDSQRRRFYLPALRPAFYTFRQPGTHAPSVTW